jgi:hypothetical protein
MANGDQQDLPQVDLPALPEMTYPQYEQAPGGVGRIYVGTRPPQPKVATPPEETPPQPRAAPPAKAPPTPQQAAPAQAPADLSTMSAEQYLSATPPEEPKKPAAKPAAEPTGAPAAPAAPTQAQTAEQYLSPTPPPEKEVPEVGGGEASMRGIANSMTFGFDAPIRGAASAIGQYFSQNLSNEPPTTSIGEAYDKARQEYYERSQAAQAQHPYAYIAGQVGGAIPMAFGSGALGLAAKALPWAVKTGKILGTTAEWAPEAVAEAPSIFGAAERAVVQGAKYGTLQGAGETASSGDYSGEHFAQNVLGGAAAGAIGGAVLAPLAEAGGRAVRWAYGLKKGARDPTARARSQLMSDVAKNRQYGLGVKFDDDMVKAANDANIPIHVGDLINGENVYARIRAGANVSPTAREMYRPMIERHNNLAQNVALWLRGKVGGMNAPAFRAAKEAESALQNRGNYRVAYEKGDRPIWNDEIERLVGGSDAIERALPNAVIRGRNRATAEGFGSFNPKVGYDPNTQTVVMQKAGSNVPQTPNIRMWDYIQRELRQMATDAAAKGDKEAADSIGKIRTQLNAQLDKEVPEFQTAREGAAKFFGAEDMLEAGKNFVAGTDEANIWKALQIISDLKPADRDLFKLGFVSELANRLEQAGNKPSVLNQIFINSPAARNRIATALGTQDAKEFEALWRVRDVINRMNDAMRNSTTVRQLGEQHLATETIGGLEAIREFGGGAKAIAGLIAWGMAKSGAQAIDNRLAEETARLVTSKNTNELVKGYKLIADNPLLMSGVRAMTNASARVIAEHLGLSGEAGLYESMRGGGGEHHPAAPHDQSDLMDQISSQGQ